MRSLRGSSLGDVLSSSGGRQMKKKGAAAWGVDGGKFVRLCAEPPLETRRGKGEPVSPSTLVAPSSAWLEK